MLASLRILKLRNWDLPISVGLLSRNKSYDKIKWEILIITMLYLERDVLKSHRVVVASSLGALFPRLYQAVRQALPVEPRPLVLAGRTQGYVRLDCSGKADFG